LGYGSTVHAFCGVRIPAKNWIGVNRQLRPDECTFG
jgi:hypothetical protein